MPDSSTDISATLFESAPDALLVTNRAATIVMANLQCERMFGYAREQLVGQHLSLLIPQKFHESHQAHHLRYCATPTFRPMGAALDLSALRSDGTEFAVSISLSPLPVHPDGDLLTIAAVRDVTAEKVAAQQREDQVKQREAQAELRIAEAAQRLELAEYDSDEYHRALAHYTQLVRHRLANPLHVIQGMARTLLELPEVDGATRTQMITAIRDAADKLANITLFNPELLGIEEQSLHPKPFE